MAGKVEITDKDGWKREFPLEKAIVNIGCDPRNEVVLDPAHGGGVSPRHIQLISGAGGQGYRLINIGAGDIWVGEAGEKNLPPRAFTDIGPGERVRLGDFNLVFAGEGGAGPRGGSIGLDVILQDTQLGLDRPLEGAIVVRNLGDKTGVQFKLEVVGLDPEMYEIGPGPILFPSAEREVFFRLLHPRKPKPAAGELRFSIRAAAPTAYPGESATVNKVVQLLPFYTYQLEVVVPE